MLIALRRCSAAGLLIDKPCKPERQQLLQLAASTRNGRPSQARSRHLLSAKQQLASDAVLSEPDAPPKPLNVIEEAAAQLGGADLLGSYHPRGCSTAYVESDQRSKNHQC
jgi:hypothetical protein